MKSSVSCALRAAIVGFLCAAIAVACNTSSPVEVDSTFEAALEESWLEASPLQIDLGATSTSASITLKTSYRRRVSWTASENASWLSLEKSSGSVRRGSPIKIPLSVERDGLPAGDYSTSVTISSTKGTETVDVRLSVATSGTTTFSVSPQQLDFGSTATSLSVTLKNTSSKSLSWNASEGVGWLGLNTMSGTISANSQKTVVISISRTGKTAGTYSTNVKFSAGTAGSGTVTANMTVPSSSGTVLLAGQLVNQFTGAALQGITVQYGGKTATTNSSGMFTISGSPVSTLQQLTLSGSGVYKRVTFARTGDSKWGVIPSSFNITAFNDVARDEWGSSTVRWVTRPTIYVDSRPEGFSSSEMSTWISQVKVQAAEFVSKWSGTVIQPSSVIVTSSPPADLTTGTIVIHISDNSSDFGGSSGAIGYARLSQNSDRSIRSSAVWLRYSLYPGTTKADKRKGILGHELGHAMGLGHMDRDMVSLMQPSIGTKTDLLEFDRQVASFVYTRSPSNTSPDTDSSASFLGALAPSAAPVSREWVCEAGEDQP
ncbi:MAG TPA: hypothetical protein VFH11_01030 [Gemmatimonadota bacterium]|nr:hypothetical protein [Gemmatimonadota bacterium]